MNKQYHVKSIKLLISFILLIHSLSMSASNNLVSIVCTGEGPTKEQAIDNAIRYALIQTYGAFVSSRTDIFNDEIILDRNSIITSGNIVKYEEISTTHNPDNDYYTVVINTTLSIGDMVKYAKNKGSECEIAGNTFGLNNRLYRFNKENEKNALNNLCDLVNQMRPLYDYSIDVEEPVIDKSNEFALIAITTSVIPNTKVEECFKLIKNTLISISNTKEEIKTFEDSGYQFYGYMIFESSNCQYCEWSDLLGFIPTKRNLNNPSSSNALRSPLSEMYYFYNVLPQDLVNFLFESVFDYSIADNNGRIFPHAVLKQNDEKRRMEFKSSSFHRGLDGGSGDCDIIGNYFFKSVRLTPRDIIFHHFNDEPIVNNGIGYYFFEDDIIPKCDAFCKKYGLTTNDPSKNPDFAGIVFLYTKIPNSNSTYRFKKEIFKLPVSVIDSINNISISPFLNKQQFESDMD